MMDLPYYYCRAMVYVVLAWTTLSVSFSTAFPFFQIGSSTGSSSWSRKWFLDSRRAQCNYKRYRRSVQYTVLYALTERQMQFWEDVEKGVKTN